MKTKSKIKKEFKEFFKKHPNIKKIPFVLTVVIPKYECKGERVVNNFWDIAETDSYIEEYFNSDEKVDFTKLWDTIHKDLPSISDKDAFYLFDEDCLVVIHNEKTVKIEEIDFSDEVWDMY